MDKVKLEFKVPENKLIEYNGLTIEITPLLTIAQQVFLINRYIDEYFNKTENALIKNPKYNYFEAELNLKNYILQTNTNIDAGNLDNDVYADGAFWDRITSEIINYDDFRYTLDIIIDEIKEQITLDNSVGKVISGLVDKAYEILNKLSDISPEEIEKLQQTGTRLIEDLKNSSVLGNNPAPITESGKKEEK